MGMLAAAAMTFVITRLSFIALQQPEPVLTQRVIPHDVKSAIQLGGPTLATTQTVKRVKLVDRHVPVIDQAALLAALDASMEQLVEGSTTEALPGTTYIRSRSPAVVEPGQSTEVAGIDSVIARVVLKFPDIPRLPSLPTSPSSKKPSWFHRPPIHIHLPHPSFPLPHWPRIPHK